MGDSAAMQAPKQQSGNTVSFKMLATNASASPRFDGLDSSYGYVTPGAMGNSPYLPVGGVLSHLVGARPQQKIQCFMYRGMGSLPQRQLRERSLSW